jgi:hypothetical protein
MDMPDNFTLPDGYEYLWKDCESFFKDHPHYDRNVFIMTSFDGHHLLAQLDNELRRALHQHRLVGVRADDRIYPSDSQLWRNVCVYMLCCKYGVAILEDHSRDEFNPNVALEIGFMRALDKRTLLLADRRFSKLRADISGTVRFEFDITNQAGTLAEPIERWIRSLGLDLKAGRSPLQQQALKAYRRLLNIQCALFVRDEVQRKREEDDEFWYFGEEINRYRALLLQHRNVDHERAVEDAEPRVARNHDFNAIDKLIERFAKLAQ